MDSTNAYIFAGSGTPAEQVNLSTGTIVYLVADSLGSVRGAVASSGSLSGSVDYDAWGNPETAGGLSSYTPVGFAGAYTNLSGKVYLIGRYYDPATGQFLSVDPLVAQTQQAYVYVEDDPVNAIDPTGLLCSVGKSANSIVNTYLRKNGRTIWLRCGQKGSSGWGYRHIVEGKHFGGNVNGFVRQYFIGAAVFEGTLVESGRNIVYQEAFHCGIFQCGGTYNFRVNVVIKNTTNNIVTAYITNGKLDALQWGPGGPF
jgi:RHS repeat-associated protein